MSDPAQYRPRGAVPTGVREPVGRAPVRSAPRRPWQLRAIEAAMVVTDVGFLLYWSITALGLLPPELAYSDYTDPRVVAWNWSFAPIDLVVSATGLTGIALLHRHHPAWAGPMIVSLVLTSASGMMAVSYWAIRAEFDPAWWGPNLFLLLYPVPALVWLLRTTTGSRPLLPRDVPAAES